MLLNVVRESVPSISHKDLLRAFTVQQVSQSAVLPLVSLPAWSIGVDCPMIEPGQEAGLRSCFRSLVRGRDATLLCPYHHTLTYTSKGSRKAHTHL